MTRWIDNKGYVRVTDSTSRHGWAYEHRKIVERVVGRRLERTEHVHHKNGKKDDNRITNLEVLSASKHIASHNSSEPKRKKGVRSAYDQWVADGRVGLSPTRPAVQRAKRAKHVAKQKVSRMERLRAYWQAKHPITTTIPTTRAVAGTDYVPTSSVSAAALLYVPQTLTSEMRETRVERARLAAPDPKSCAPLVTGPSPLCEPATDRSPTQPNEAPTTTKSTTCPDFRVSVSLLARCARREDV